MASLGPGSNDAPQTASRDTNVGWYDPPITTVEQPTRDLLEQYAHFPPDEVIPRLMEARDKIWQVFPFPCVGQFRFVDLHLHRQKSYRKILDSIKDGARFIDIGCCFAQDMRKMVLGGAPSSNMYGIELHGGFIDLAYDFFGDRATLAAHFLVGDLMDQSNEALRAIEGTVDIAHLGMVLHLWSLEGQIQFCERVVQLMRPAAGAVIVGHSAGRVEASEWFNPVGKTMFKHNVESFAKMWDDVGRRTGTSWNASSWLALPPEESRHWDDPLARKLMFEVQKL